jgi:L-ribulose-5-phosphate 3-epimerase
VGLRLGYNTNGFASHRLEDALSILADLGYRSVGLTLDHHALDPFVPETPERVRACRALLERLELTPVVETGARYLLDPWRKHRPTLLDGDAAQRARRVDFLERSIDLAAALGAGVVSLWSGAADADEGRQVLDARLAQALRALCDHAEARGVVLAFEPEPGMHIESMADFDRIDVLVDHPSFQLTLDVGHAHITEAAGAEATVRTYAPRLANVHLEGMRRDTHDHLVPWEGDLDVRGVVRTLVDVGYQGPATYELSRHSHDAVRVARRAYAHMADLLPG